MFVLMSMVIAGAFIAVFSDVDVTFPAVLAAVVDLFAWFVVGAYLGVY